MNTEARQASAARLQRDAIGLAPVLFQSITHMAPAAAVAFSIIFAVTYAGGATPLAVLLALVACLMVAISIGQLARHLPSAGGLYTFAVHVQGALGIAVALILGFALGGPLLAFALLGTIATLIIVCIYILTNLSNLVFYMREHRDEMNPLLNVVVPVVGILIFIPVLLASFGIDFGGLGIAGLTAPANAAPWIVLAWLVIGAAVFFYVNARTPAKIQETATTFIEG